MNKKQREIVKAQTKLLSMQDDMDKWDDAEEFFQELLLKFDFLEVGVADGHATYVWWEDLGDWVEFRWFEGGSDGYVSGFGTTIAIPKEVAVQSINRRRKLNELFAEQRKKQEAK